MKRALVTGCAGQDGSYLCELLLEKDYEVHGIIRRSSSFNTGRIDKIFSKLHLYHGDMTDSRSLAHIVQAAQPDEIYHLAAQSHVAVSWELPEYTFNTNATGTQNLLEIAFQTVPGVRFYQAGTSELFGGDYTEPQNEETPFNPKSPYAVSKQAAFYSARNFRNRGMFVSSGILFNHESPRRGETFVTRKIVRGLVNIHLGKQTELRLGNLDAKRDWGFAPEFVDGMWRMLQQDKPDDYVLATEESHSVRDFLNAVSRYIGIRWEKHVVTDSRYYRPSEVNALLGDYTKAEINLRWKPKVRFEQLVRIMVDAEFHGE